MINLIKLKFFLVDFHETDWVVVISVDGPIWLWINKWRKIFSVTSSTSDNMNWVRWFKKSVFEIIVRYFVVIDRICSLLIMISVDFSDTIWQIGYPTVAVRTVGVFVPTQAKIDLVFMEDFFESDFDAIKCSISMESIFSQTSTFMIAITAIHWSMTHCNDPWSHFTILICLF